MTVVLVDGCSGAGKSTVAAALATRGLASIDADEDPGLCHWVDADGRIVGLPVHADLVWFDRHRWEWDPARLDELISAAPATLFVCGNAANEVDLLDRFDCVLLLVIDESTMLTRIDDPQRDNYFGRAREEREFPRCALPIYEARMRRAGAIPIDATQPLGRVVDVIVSMAGSAN
jgi:hypothetical protein